MSVSPSATMYRFLEMRELEALLAGIREVGQCFPCLNQLLPWKFRRRTTTQTNLPAIIQRVTIPGDDRLYSRHDSRERLQNLLRSALRE